MVELIAMLTTRFFSLALISAAVCCVLSPIPVSAQATFELPRSRRITLAKPVDCRAIASTFLSEKDGRLEAETKRGTDHLIIIRTGRALEVTTHHEEKSVPEETDVYAITAETVDFVSAVQGTKPLPVVHGLVFNKRLGMAVWSESDSTFFMVSDYPFGSTVFLSCKN